MWLLSAAVCSTVWQRTRPRDRSSRRKRIAHPAAFIGREVPRVQLLSSSVEGADAQSWIKDVVFHLTRVFVHTVLQLLLMPCARPCLPSHVREGRLGAIAYAFVQILESRRQKNHISRAASFVYLGLHLLFGRSRCARMLTLFCGCRCCCCCCCF